ncbi:MAG: flagellar export chaperone FliS [Candidatus Schekmanbacteria bacterium]|nr:flagellar export chaperone FliS [Candidatus Schekmanbacteria bacterium]
MTTLANQNKYKSTQISTASSVKIIVLLYDGAINFLEQGKIKIKERDFKLKGVYLSKASRIVAELNSALDEKVDKKLVENLQSLYEFVNYQILQANLKNEIVFIDNAINILKTIKESWDKVIELQFTDKQIIAEKRDSTKMITLTV